LTIPRLQHQPRRPILPIQADFLILHHAEGLARELLAVDFFGVDAKRVAQFIAGETVETGVVGVQFGARRTLVSFIISSSRNRVMLLEKA
jgi:hypothetical protein